MASVRIDCHATEPLPCLTPGEGLEEGLGRPVLVIHKRIDIMPPPLPRAPLGQQRPALAHQEEDQGQELRVDALFPRDFINEPSTTSSKRISLRQKQPWIESPGQRVRLCNHVSYPQECRTGEPVRGRVKVEASF